MAVTYDDKDAMRSGALGEAHHLALSLIRRVSGRQTESFQSNKLRS